METSPPVESAYVEHGQAEIRCVTVDTKAIDSEGTSQEVKLHVRVWGNPVGVPVLFVHGGPGNSVGEYAKVNPELFQVDRYHVVEVDQRGTGESHPSVRKDLKNMRYYEDISIQQMSADFEKVRTSLGIDRWLVFGGSWGSTLALDYAIRYPQQCIALIIRGIFTNTEPEFDAVYKRGSFEERQTSDGASAAAPAQEPPTSGLRPSEDDSSGKHEHALITVERKNYFLDLFDGFYQVAANDYAAENPGRMLDANDARGIVSQYEKMIMSGNRRAIWIWHAFETNLMEPDGSEDLLDYKAIDVDEEDFEHKGEFEIASSVAFFEARLFLRGTFEDDVRLVDRARSLPASVPTWLVQGLGDEVCPERFARHLASVLQSTGALSAERTHFVSAGHRATEGGIKAVLKDCLDDFYTMESKGKTVPQTMATRKEL